MNSLFGDEFKKVRPGLFARAMVHLGRRSVWIDYRLEDVGVGYTDSVPLTTECSRRNVFDFWENIDKAEDQNRYYRNKLWC